MKPRWSLFKTLRWEASSAPVGERLGVVLRLFDRGTHKWRLDLIKTVQVCWMRFGSPLNPSRESKNKPQLRTFVGIQSDATLRLCPASRIAPFPGTHPRTSWLPVVLGGHDDSLPISIVGCKERPKAVRHHHGASRSGYHLLARTSQPTGASTALSDPPPESSRMEAGGRGLVHSFAMDWV